MRLLWTDDGLGELKSSVSKDETLLASHKLSHDKLLMELKIANMWTKMKLKNHF